jgi:hypothetical protein
VTLGIAAAKLFDGTILVNNRLHGTGFVFVGFASEIPLMQSLFLHLYNSWKGFVEKDLEAAKAQFAERELTRADDFSFARGNFGPRTWAPKDTMKFKHGHGQGYAEAIYLRCVTLAKERETKLNAENNDCRALVIVRGTEIKKFLDDRGTKTVKLNQTRGSNAGYSAGARAGQSVALGGALK